MPSSDDFQLEILVNKEPIQEFVDKKTGKVYVESSLFTPVSYKQEISEKVEDKVVTQSVPVTPYEIRLKTSAKARGQYFRILVDGMKIKGMSITPGKEKYVSGFRDCSKHKGKISNVNRDHIGTIRVECWKGELKARIEDKRNPLKFTQATKNDTYYVTKGSSLLPTSRAGKTIEEKKDTRSVDKWKLEREMSSLTVHYRMASELAELGFIIPGHKSTINNQSQRRVLDPERKRPLSAVIDLTGDDVIEEKIRKVDVIDVEKTNEKNKALSGFGNKGMVKGNTVLSEKEIKIERGDESISYKNSNSVREDRVQTHVIENVVSSQEGDKTNKNHREEEVDNVVVKQESQVENEEIEDNVDKQHDETQKSCESTSNEPKENTGNGSFISNQLNQLSDAEESMNIDDEQGSTKEKYKESENMETTADSETTNTENPNDTVNTENTDKSFATENTENINSTINTENTENPDETINTETNDNPDSTINTEITENTENMETDESDEGSKNAKTNQNDESTLESENTKESPSQNDLSVSQGITNNEENDSEDNCVLSEDEVEDPVMSTASTIVG